MDNKKTNVLFIENDNYWFQQISSSFMLRPEFNIELSTNLLEAMNKLSSGANFYKAIVISTSVMLPNIDSTQVINNIREKIPFAKIIYVVESNDPSQIVALNQSGADGTLIKPYSVDDLIEKITAQTNLNKSQENKFFKNNNFSHQNTDQNLQINNLFEMGQSNYEENQTQNYIKQQRYNNQNFNSMQNNQNTPIGGIYNNQNLGARISNNIVRIPQNITIAVHCPKGGVGKSSISKELAVTYAQSEVNNNPLRVCLVDMDIDYGDIAVMLDLKQNKTMSDWARSIRGRIGNMNESDIMFSYEEIEKYYLLHHKSGLKVLAAPTNHRDSALINGQIVRIVLNNLKKHFDVIIIDTGNNVKDFTVISMEIADQVIMICNTDVATVAEILTLRKTLEQIQFPINKISLLMNEVKKEDVDHIRQISSFLGLPLIGEIPKISSLKAANDNGETLVMGNDNPFTIGIKKVANTILPVVKRRKERRKENKSLINLIISKLKK